MPEKKLTIICSWCGKYIGEKPGQGVEGVSHSMCRDCWAELHPDKPYPKDKSQTGDTDHD